MASFHALAETLADIAETSGRHAKADRLGALLADLDDADLRRAARWAAGRVFPLSDQRTVSVGFAALRAATATATGAEPDDLDAALVRLGDPGDVTAGAIAALVPPVAPSLSLADAEAFFAQVAATRGSKARTALVAEMLGRLAPVEARFLVKLLAGELRIGMLEGGVESAVARLYGLKVGDVQRANMLTGDLGETAVLARHGRLAEARLRLFHALKFMLATAAEASDARTLAEEVGRQIAPPVAVEDKFDGIRAQAHVAADPGDPALHGVAHDGARVALFSRTLDAITGAFPDLVGPLAALAEASPAGLILDGEIVPLDGEGAIVPFQSLQKRLGRKAASAELQAEVPVAFVVYDVLAADGATTLAQSYRDRQQLLDGLAFQAPLRRSAVTELDDLGRLDDLFDEARARGNEGLMVKAFDSVYKPGRRGRDWLKVKKALATLDVVVTAVQRGHGGRRKLLSDVTFAVRASETDGTLLNVGKAYSGLTDAELAELTEWFEAHTLQTFAHGKVRTVEPQVVMEVAFDNVQVSKRHKGGYALRFPRIVRWRRDKPAAEVDTLQTVAALAGDA
ncbi:ATP-dependent DNA ligase [Rubrivirga sp. IMCC45206]|uniref:ATP-dependent DNA ligase n=1 Tax=Rubrivirga sp. IMCC45206 TaxID=3391614 RepID=UPI00398FA9B5